MNITKDIFRRGSGVLLGVFMACPLWGNVLCLNSQLNAQSQQEINAEKSYSGLATGFTYTLSFEVTSISPSVDVLVDDGNNLQSISIVTTGSYVFNLQPLGTTAILMVQSITGKKQPRTICLDNLHLESVSQQVATIVFKEPLNDYRYAFNGVEKDDSFKGLGNSYSYDARMYDPRMGRWLSLDPEFKKRSWVTPYNFNQNSPIARVDPDGRLDGWYKDEDGTMQYDPNVRGHEDMQGCQDFFGCNYTLASEPGHKITYNDDGSIFFENEADAYSRMWNNSLRNGREQMGVIFENGVLVLPEYENLADWSKVEQYDYGFKTENDEVRLINQYGTFPKPIIGTIHTHQNPGVEGFSSDDIDYFKANTPEIVFLILEDDLFLSKRNRTVYAAYAKDDWFNELGMEEVFTRENLLSGKVGLIPTLLYIGPQIKDQ